jgi:hypothetical protein
MKIPKNKYWFFFTYHLRSVNIPHVAILGFVNDNVVLVKDSIDDVIRGAVCFSYILTTFIQKAIKIRQKFKMLKITMPVTANTLMPFFYHSPIALSLFSAQA